MLTIFRKLFFMIVTFISLVMTNSGYAEKVTVPCRVQDRLYPVNQTVLSIDPKEIISITFDGVEVDGYTQGLIKKTAIELYDEDADKFSNYELDKLFDLHFHVAATCHGSDKSIEDMLPGMTFSCNKGESILIEQYEPICSKTNPYPINKPDRRSIFTVVRTKEDKKKEKVEIKTNISNASFWPVAI